MDLAIATNQRCSCLTYSSANLLHLPVADPNVYNKHQPMIWGSDRIQSGYTTIMAKPVRPAYVLTFNEPNYAYGGGNPTNINSPAQAAALWPNITSLFSPQGIQLLAPSAINCNYPGDSNCRYVGSITGWLNAFKSVRAMVTLHLCTRMHDLWSAKLQSTL